ncbi:hypothetical protein BDV93DRAFT_528091 [Ceratobasidium sp. AG-I]|nr:hypothetical protein BDV93DRAFT_528091 [Ceratobasidium sp. AG-I]
MPAPNALVRLADQDAYVSWSSARSELSRSVQAYSHASNALSSSLANSATQRLLSHDPLDQTFTEFDSELALFDKQQQALQTGRTRLARSWNQAAPINRLSVELLSIIFLAACDLPIVKDNSPNNPSYPSSDFIAGVCYTWREIALALPSLWSQIGLIMQTPENDHAMLERIRRWGKRALNSPLELTIWTETGEYEYTGDDIWDYQVSMRQLRPVLTPLMPRVQSLNIEIRNYSQEFLQALLAFFASPKASPAHSLTLRFTHKSAWIEPLSISPWDPVYLSKAWDDESPLHDFLRSVRCLSLQSVLIPMNSDAYAGLTEIHLDNVELTPEEAGNIFTSSPALHTLSITNIELGDGFLCEPAALPNLRSVTLGAGQMKERDIGSILAMIETSSTNLSVHLILPKAGWGREMHMDQIRAFFERSRVTSLHLEMKRWSNWFSLLRSVVDHLEVLHFDGCNTWDPDAEEFIDKLDELGHPDPWPKLHTLSLTDTFVHTKILLGLLKLHKVKHFRLIDRRKPIPGDYYWTMEVLHKSISELGIDAQCLGEYLNLTCGTMQDWKGREAGLL